MQYLPCVPCNDNINTHRQGHGQVHTHFLPSMVTSGRDQCVTEVLATIIQQFPPGDLFIHSGAVARPSKCVHVT